MRRTTAALAVAPLLALAAAGPALADTGGGTGSAAAKKAAAAAAASAAAHGSPTPTPSPTPGYVAPSLIPVPAGTACLRAPAKWQAKATAYFRTHGGIAGVTSMVWDTLQVKTSGHTVRLTLEPQWTQYDSLGCWKTDRSVHLSASRTRWTHLGPGSQSTYVNVSGVTVHPGKTVTIKGLATGEYDWSETVNLGGGTHPYPSVLGGTYVGATCTVHRCEP